MKAKILTLAILALLSGCTQNTNRFQIQTVVKPMPFIEIKLQEFRNAHPDWDKNDIVRDETNSILRDSLKVWKNKLIDSLPMQLISIDKIQDNGKIVYGAIFQRSDSDENLIQSKPFSLSIMGIVDESVVRELQTDSYYKLSGNYVKTIRPATGLLVGDYYLGAYRYRITDFKIVE